MSGTSDTLFVHYQPSFAGWHVAFRQSRNSRKGGVVRRTVWQQGDQRRLIIDAGDYLTRGDADGAFEAETRELGAPHVPGKPSLGRSLVHPEEKSWSIFFTRANLFMWALSNGREYLDVESLIAPMVAELDLVRSPEPSPDMEEHLKLTPVPGEPDRSGRICLEFKTTWSLGEWAWLKFHATGATLERATEPRRLFVQPNAPGQSITVIGWVIEPGRKTYMGRYSTTSG